MHPRARRLALLAFLPAALPGCGGAGEPAQTERTPTPAAGDRWPGTVAYSAEVGAGAGLDVLVRSGRAQPRRLTSGKVDEFSPAWAPGGRWLAYRVNPPRGDEGDIWTMRNDGSRKRNLTDSPGVADWSPSVSPDGRSIAFMSSRDGAHELWLMDGALASPRELTRAGELSEYPSWSPDGGSLTYGANRSGNFEIARIGVDGSGQELLTDDPARDQWPAWSPDGDRIAFMSDRDGGEDVFVMRSDGTGVRNVTRTPELFETHPTWAADGRLTYYQHAEGPVHVRVDALGAGGDHSLPIDGTFVFDWTP